MLDSWKPQYLHITWILPSHGVSPYGMHIGFVPYISLPMLAFKPDPPHFMLKWLMEANWCFCASVCLYSASAFFPVPLYHPKHSCIRVSPDFQYSTFLPFGFKNHSGTWPSGIQVSLLDLPAPPEPGLTALSHITSHTSPERPIPLVKSTLLLHHTQSYLLPFITPDSFFPKRPEHSHHLGIKCYCWDIYKENNFTYLINNLLQSLLLFYYGNKLWFSSILKSILLNGIWLLKWHYYFLYQLMYLLLLIS